MLHTELTERWGLRYPIVGAPMAGPGGGRLARAISAAGGLGTIGVESRATPEFVEKESAAARGEDGGRFGIGLMIWAIEQRPELLEAAIAQRPFLISLSFPPGAAIEPPASYVEQVQSAGILVASQVNTVVAARGAAAAGVDLVVAQGTEAGGHTGSVGTLPLLQAVLEAVEVPVLAAGGIASVRGLAAALAAGAAGAWVGTAFLASPECSNAPAARRRVVAARETDTIHTHTFDDVQQVPWPDQYPGRALRNRFAEEWHGRGHALTDAAREEYNRARAAGDFDVAVIYAGQAVGLVSGERGAADVVRNIGEGAEALLRDRSAALLGG